MADDGKTFVGFGFGPIQSGLFLYEAAASGNFSRYVVAEVDAVLVDAVRNNGGRCDVNIARRDRAETVHLDGLEVYNPAIPADRDALVQAVAESDELATCLPSVNFYDVGKETSVARTIAEGLTKRDPSGPAIIYAAENNNKAAERLYAWISEYVRPGVLDSVQTLNTVIGKMSGVISDRDEIAALKLSPMVPGANRAVLVEEFNRILISRIELDGYRRGIEVLIEKDDLLPFEEAKLYGHNAVHALIGYLAGLNGLTTMAEAARDEAIMRTARRAFVDESGASLIRKHGSTGDPLFTARGYEEYADDLLARMGNPWLNDLVARICRDPKRKLGYDDRLYGTMRVALDHGIEPMNLALGGAAAVDWLLKNPEEGAPPGASVVEMSGDELRALLTGIWGDDAEAHVDDLVRLTREAAERIRRKEWC